MGKVRYATTEKNNILNILGADECSGGNHSCHVNARCVETVVSYHCECLSGYHGDGYNCTGMKCPFSIYKFPKTLAIFSISDIDECSEPTSNDCDLNATCINTNASYNCTCNIGFTGTQMFKVNVSPFRSFK